VPANLTPDYLAAEREYKAAQTHAERVESLERMLAALPKHKGTEKLQADLKRRKESQKKGAAHGTPFYVVEREGAGQVALAGPANSGKSSLVRALTHAEPEVADYPFTTHFPVPGMMRYENVQIQLVDLPPVSAEFTEVWLPQAIRHATSAVLVVDPGDAGVLDEIGYIEQTLDSWHVARPKLLAANKADRPGFADDFAVLEELYGNRYRCLAVSAADGTGLESFARAVFESLELVRVYTKPPGKKPDLSAPYVLRRGQTVLDAARLVHKDFAEHMKFTRLFHVQGGPAGWEPDRSMPDGLMVERTHPVQDGDILELHL
jgi:ribosome-interacting GTPase 1